MSLPLVDFRGKITHETDAVLEALHQASGRDRSEIVREVLARWADEKIHEATLIDARLHSQGLRGIARGALGNSRDDAGSPSAAGRFGSGA